MQWKNIRLLVAACLRVVWPKAYKQQQGHPEVDIGWGQVQ